MTRVLSCIVAVLVSTVAPCATHAAVSRCKCQAWVKRTLAAVKPLPMQKARAKIIDALPTACEAVPKDLKAAARIASPGKRAYKVTTAAANVLGTNCTVVDPLASATTVPAACDVMGFAASNSAVKADMRAGDYVLLLALVKLWTNHGLMDNTSERLFDTFELSSALSGEQQREKQGRSRF